MLGDYRYMLHSYRKGINGKFVVTHWKED